MAPFRIVSLLSSKLLVCASLALGLAASANDQVIGVVLGAGVNIDGVGAVGNANLTQGARIQTGDESVRIRLSNGARATLQEASQARVFADHMLLERGSAIVSTLNYRVETPEVQVAALVAGTDLAVARKSPSTLEVGAANGAARVLSSGGVLLARVDAGSVVSVNLFKNDVQGGTAAPSAISGKLMPQSDGKFTLMDAATRVTYTLSTNGASPSSLAPGAGRYVSLTGQSDSLGGKANLNVSSMSVVAATKLSNHAVTSIASRAFWSEHGNDRGDRGDHDGRGDHGDHDDHGDHGDDGDHHHHHHRPPISRP